MSNFKLQGERLPPPPSSDAHEDTNTSATHSEWRSSSYGRRLLSLKTPLNTWRKYIFNEVLQPTNQCQCYCILAPRALSRTSNRTNLLTGKVRSAAFAFLKLTRVAVPFVLYLHLWTAHIQNMLTKWAATENYTLDTRAGLLIKYQNICHWSFRC